MNFKFQESYLVQRQSNDKVLVVQRSKPCEYNYQVVSNSKTYSKERYGVINNS